MGQMFEEPSPARVTTLSNCFSISQSVQLRFLALACFSSIQFILVLNCFVAFLCAISAVVLCLSRRRAGRRSFKAPTRVRCREKDPNVSKFWKIRKNTLGNKIKGKSVGIVEDVLTGALEVGGLVLEVEDLAGPESRITRPYVH